ncbi:MAG: hypothetical protein M3N08_06455 [Pseudomonadota bacterium]|nr:hypothetical protein [Pseudomonadota bacterium]
MSDFTQIRSEASHWTNVVPLGEARIFRRSFRRPDPEARHAVIAGRIMHRDQASVSFDTL